MKKARWWLFMLLPCLSYGASNGPTDRCSTARVLTQIRPGATWVITGDSMNGIKWLDTKQKKPSAAEVEKAKAACISDLAARNALKTQARLEVKNPNTPLEKKVNDLILLLDMDR
jgi:hypothetical protein